MPCRSFPLSQGAAESRLHTKFFKPHPCLLVTTETPIIWTVIHNTLVPKEWLILWCVEVCADVFCFKWKMLRRRGNCWGRTRCIYNLLFQLALSPPPQTHTRSAVAVSLNHFRCFNQGNNTLVVRIMNFESICVVLLWLVGKSLLNWFNVSFYESLGLGGGLKWMINKCIFKLFNYPTLLKWLYFWVLRFYFSRFSIASVRLLRFSISVSCQCNQNIWVLNMSPQSQGNSFSIVFKFLVYRVKYSSSVANNCELQSLILVDQRAKFPSS